MKTEREIAEKMIKDAEAMIEDAESKLAALDKPELRHGDYGYTRNKIPVLRTINADDKARVKTSYPEGLLNNLGECWTDGIRLGNIFDDLDRNSKDLEEFETVQSHFGNAILRMGCTIDPRGYIFIQIGMHYIHFNIDQATVIHQKLGQLLATTKRKNQ